MRKSKNQDKIRPFFETLWAAWGAQNWWPAETPFEVIVGAILTQNTAWTNVELALKNLRQANVLSIAGIRTTGLEELEALIRPSGFFRQKATRLKTFVGWLDRRYQGSLDEMFATPTAVLREELLALNGIGPETADSILLYAGQHEIFVIDAYTRRIFERHSLIKSTTQYDEIRTMVESALLRPATGIVMPPLPSTSVESGPGPVEEVPLPVVHPPSKMSEALRSDTARTYNEFHALIVQVAKHYCQSRVARCELCPLRGYLDHPVRIQGGSSQGTASPISHQRPATGSSQGASSGSYQGTASAVPPRSRPKTNSVPNRLKARNTRNPT